MGFLTPTIIFIISSDTFSQTASQIIFEILSFKHLKSQSMTGFYKIWARRDSNPRPKDYESSALPLRHRPLLKYGVFLFSCFALPVSCASGATYCFENVTFSHLFLQCHRPLLKYGVFYSVVAPCLCLALATLPTSRKT